jgi:hypothetical protein
VKYKEHEASEVRKLYEGLKTKYNEIHKRLRDNKDKIDYLRQSNAYLKKLICKMIKNKES